MNENPLKIIAFNWYGWLTPNRAAKVDRLWRQLIKAVMKPAQGDLFS